MVLGPVCPHYRSSATESNDSPAESGPDGGPLAVGDRVGYPSFCEGA